MREREGESLKESNEMAQQLVEPHPEGGTSHPAQLPNPQSTSIKTPVLLRNVPDIPLVNAFTGETVNFHSIVASRLAVVDFFYSDCDRRCVPIGKNVAHIVALLGDLVFENNIHFVRISFDSRDTGDDVIEYARKCDLAVVSPSKPSPSPLPLNHVHFFSSADDVALASLRYGLGMYEERCMDSLKKNHSGMLILLNERLNAVKMCGGNDNVINTSRQILQMTFSNYALNSGPELGRLCFGRFLGHGTTSSAIFNNIPTLSLQYTVPFLPEIVLAPLREHMTSSSEEVTEVERAGCCCQAETQ